MAGMELSNGLFRSSILLRACEAQSKVKRHEEALISCDAAVEQRRTPVAGSGFVNPGKLGEALRARAEALERDNDHDEVAGCM